MKRNTEVLAQIFCDPKILFVLLCPKWKTRPARRTKWQRNVSVGDDDEVFALSHLPNVNIPRLPTFLPRQYEKRFHNVPVAGYKGYLQCIASWVVSNRIRWSLTILPAEADWRAGLEAKRGARIEGLLVTVEKEGGASSGKAMWPPGHLCPLVPLLSVLLELAPPPPPKSLKEIFPISQLLNYFLPFFPASLLRPSSFSWALE